MPKIIVRCDCALKLAEFSPGRRPWRSIDVRVDEPHCWRAHARVDVREDSASAFHDPKRSVIERDWTITCRRCGVRWEVTSEQAAEYLDRAVLAGLDVLDVNARDLS